MNDTNSKNCQSCGAPIPASGTEALCPACLMADALEADTQLEENATMIVSPAESLSKFGSAKLPCDFGGYRLLNSLGRGGMGAVYEAEQISTGRRVALKMLGQQIESSEMRSRFLREGRLAAGIRHPNSLYVYGTEEIEGIPVITMEIAASGTLADELKKRGPLPIPDAVDAILGLIAGLETAHSVGVLHRDVKPSNVFLNRDGSVKVGDYGLSVSTVASIESFATATGVALGTPAYAAPEQLKGQDLDVRADIYSVGATLYTLLTNKAPIEGTNPVHIVAAALDEKPKPLNEIRRDAPDALAQIVARCLAKKPEQRPASYAELRVALLPFSSETPHPAAMSRRTLAGLLDGFLAWFIPGMLATSFYGAMNSVEMFAEELYGPLLALALWQILYTGIPEGVWGMSLGKWLAGIRVARTDGLPAARPRAIARAFVCWLSCQGAIMALLIMEVFDLAHPESYDGAGLVYGCSQLALMLAPFVTMRRRNGMATLWDLITGTRVFEQPRGDIRPPVTVDSAREIRPENTEFIGPFGVDEKVSPDWVVGIDPALRRPVWLRREPHGRLDAKRRDLARPGRARWLQIAEANSERWNVFEAHPGISLASLIDREAPHWESVRHWLYDLTIELAQAAQDETLPNELGLEHVWITATGRAILLDDPWPKASGQESRTDVSDTAGRLRFLDRIAQCARPTSVPLHARVMLKSLAEGSFEKLSFLAGNLRSMLKRNARFSRTARATSLFAMPIIMVAFAFLGIFVTDPANHRARSAALRSAYPDLPPLNDVIRYRWSVNYKERRFIHVHIAGHYADEDFSNYHDWDRFRLLGENEKEIVAKVMNQELNFNDRELEESDRRLRAELSTFLESERRRNYSRSVRNAS